MLKKLTCFLPNGMEVNFANEKLPGYVSISDIEIKKGIAIIYLVRDGKKIKVYYNCPFIFEEES